MCLQVEVAGAYLALASIPSAGLGARWRNFSSMTDGLFCLKNPWVSVGGEMVLLEDFLRPGAINEWKEIP